MRRSIEYIEKEESSYKLNAGRFLHVSPGLVVGHLVIMPVYEQGDDYSDNLFVSMTFKDKSGVGWQYSSAIQNFAFFPDESESCQFVSSVPDGFDVKITTEYDGGAEYTFPVSGRGDVTERFVFMTAYYYLKFEVDKIVVFFSYFSTTFEDQKILVYEIPYNGMMWKRYYVKKSEILVFKEDFVKIDPFECENKLPVSECLEVVS